MQLAEFLFYAIINAVSKFVTRPMRSIDSLVYPRQVSLFINDRALHKISLCYCFNLTYSEGIHKLQMKLRNDIRSFSNKEIEKLNYVNGDVFRSWLLHVIRLYYYQANSSSHKTGLVSF